MTTPIRENIKYIRLRNNEEVIAEMTTTEDTVEMHQPVLLMVVSMYEEGRQMLNFREYLPPTIVKEQKLVLPKSEVLYVLDIKDEFADQYTEMCVYLFEEVEERKTPKKKVDASEAAAKVVSLAEAILEKKGKPIH
jgi:hypothetical protein